ncbi:Eco57I restriction-modification methylase domain-containing protein [Sphingomonas aerolata]|uniref:Eco57I restriction-modification methylase domain-containing protein n=1 Tax=Sphingomonas aerolata TaxID=185951 RepID=UPI002FE40F67
MAQNRQIVGISLPPATAKAFKEEAKRRNIAVRTLFQELWAGYSPQRHSRAMTNITSERELAHIAGSLIGDCRLTASERRLVGNRPKVGTAIVASCRDLIRAGQDPLGEALIALRSPENRRDVGAVYTPEAIVDAMVGWAAHRGDPVRVVDPGAGSGRFLAAAAMAFPEAALVACDIDPLAMLLLRANAAVLGFSDRLDVRLVEYRLLKLAPASGPTLYIGNPPYVRHHKIGEDAKAWFSATAERLGFKASTLAGLHVHFFLRTREIATPGDYGAFVTSSEWMDVNYGSVLREMLADGLGGSSLQVFAPNGMPFANAMTTGAITTFVVGNRPDQFTVREVVSADELDDLDAGRAVSWDEVAKHSRWSQMVKPRGERPEGMVELGELFRVHRGGVTGNNEVFVENSDSDPSARPWMVPAVTKAKDLIEAGGRLTAAKAKNLRKLVVIPADMHGLERHKVQSIEQFKRWAKSKGAHQSFTAKQRRAWWAVSLKEAAPILCTYMGRRPPVFVRNIAGVPHINIAHGLYPRVPMKAADLDAYSTWLSNNVCVSEGRTYAGGLTKFEPKEVERILVPCLNRIHEKSDRMDPRSTDRRREGFARNFPQGAD